MIGGLWRFVALCGGAGLPAAVEATLSRANELHQVGIAKMAKVALQAPC